MVTDAATPAVVELPARGAAGAARSRAAGVAMLVAASVLWSLSGVVVKVVKIDAIAFAFWRSLAAATVMLLLLPLGRGKLPPAKWMAFSATLYTLVVTLLITSMAVSTAATGILLQYTAPLFCAFFARVFLGRSIGTGTMVAMGIGAAGLAIMVGGSWKPDNWRGPFCGLLSRAA